MASSLAASRRVRSAFSAAVAAGVVAVLAGAASAITIVVDSPADDDGQQHCTLRQAVAASTTRARQGTCAAGGGTDLIVFAAALGDGISIGSADGPIVLASGRVTIDGGETGVLVAADRSAVVVGSDARLEVRNLTFADAGGSALVNQGSLRVSGCTFIANSAGFGGAILSHGATTVVNSTFVGNRADLGGAIASLFGPLTVINSTFAANEAAPGATSGAIFAAGSAITLRGVILAGSPGGNCDLRVPRVAFAPNISDDQTCDFGDGLDGLDPRLDAAGLADHGGSTQTIALQPSSPSIDLLRPDLCTDAASAPLAIDQRGFSRPAGADCDAGAFEVDAHLLPTPTPAAEPPPPTPGVPRCIGDCADDGAVTIDDLMLGVGIALGAQPLSECQAIDQSDDGTVTVYEVVRAVIAALSGCPS